MILQERLPGFDHCQMGRFGLVGVDAQAAFGFLSNTGGILNQPFCLTLTQAMV
ncbi:MAG: hypothetical protein K6U11_08055 [bacterium]|nr:hypothetical protein [bacterium]